MDELGTGQSRAGKVSPGLQVLVSGCHQLQIIWHGSHAEAIRMSLRLRFCGTPKSQQLASFHLTL